MTSSTEPTAFYPPEGFGAPKDRRASGAGPVGLPPGTQVFSADDHISLAEDIFYQRLPASMRENAPRIWYSDGAFELGAMGTSFLPPQFSHVLMQYDPLPGSSTADLDARLEQLAADGITRELAFPNALLALLHLPDKALREACFRVYNEYIAELQERARGRFYGAGLINWWDAAGAARTLTEMKSLGVRTFLMPLSPGQDDDGKQIDYGSTAMDGVWDAIEESGIAVSHHIGETGLKTPCEHNPLLVGMLVQVASFREMFGKYLFSGILDRHPTLTIGWFEGGVNWVPAALQDAAHMLASYQHMTTRAVEHDVWHYWRTHMYSSFMVDPLGLSLVDQIGADKIMWSSDFPHNESTFGYSRRSLSAVVDSVGPERAEQIVSSNVQAFLGIQ
jgi:predicted TIM-barrel fold metal-dependent hydrolase